MQSVKGAIVAMICLYEISHNNGATHIQRNILDFPEQELVFNYDSYRDGTVTYATCKKNNATDERKCKVVREKSANSRDTQSCDVTLKLDQRKGTSAEKDDEIFIVPLGKDDAILYLIEKAQEASVKFITINLNDCKLAETEIHVSNPDNNPKKAVIVVPYNDSFDVYYRDSNQCGDNGHCQMNIKTESIDFGGSDATVDSNLYQSFFPYIVPVSSQARDKGVFYIKYISGSTSEYEFILKKPDRSTKSLGTHKVYYPIVKSTTHDLIGVCFTKDPANLTFTCAQYDTNGNLKFKIDAVNASDNTAVVYAYNLPKGGFYVFAGKCEKRSCELDEVDFFVIKIDSDGKNVGSFDVGKLKIESVIKGIKVVPSLYINENNEYCISIATYKSTDSGYHDSGYISSTAYCFTDADFTK